MIAFGFDFDHTLGVDHGLERRAFADYAQELGTPIDLDDPRCFERIDGVLGRMRTGAISIDTMVAEFFADFAGEARGERWRAICFGLVPQLVRPLPGAVALLRALRERGVPYAILTNGWTPLQQRKIAQALGTEPAPRVLVSDELGAQKPSPVTFDALVAALDVPREAAWYVGDNPEADVAGALAAGLRAVWFDWEGLRYPQNLPPPTLRIGTLGELETLVQNATAP